MNASKKKWSDNRIALGEVVSGGYFVFRRGETTGRIKVNPVKLPFEHATREKAESEARRLAETNPLITFSIFQEIGSVTVTAGKAVA